MTKIKIKAGDIFSVPLDETQCGFGQVAFHGKHDLYVLLFDHTSSIENLSFDNLLEKNILFAATTTDARLWHGIWKVVGNEEPPMEKVPLPYYKIGPPSDCYLEDFEGKKIRKLEGPDVEAFDFRLSVSPMRLEKALKAYYDKLPWSSDYEKLTYAYVSERSKLVI